MKDHFTWLKLGLAVFFSGVLFPSQGRAATLTVCTSGCAFSSAQAALDASNNGDTIILTAGQNLGSLTIPGGRHDLTIKSSQIDSYARNTRIVRSSPALARLTTITAGSFQLWFTGTPGSSVLTSEIGGNTPYPHGFNIGDKVAIGGTRYSAYECASVNQPPYTDGACDASRVGFFNIRTRTNLANGEILYFKGRNLPTPLLENTPYYVVNFGFGGSVSNADKFQIAATPGGPPIVIPQFDPTGVELVIEVRPLPQAIQDTMYVVGVPSPTTLELSPTPGGTPTVWTQIPSGYNGGGQPSISPGFFISKIAPVYNLTFDGIEVLPASDAGVYYPFFISHDAGNADGENYNINIYRCWIHGAGDQKDFPMTLLNIGGHDLDIGWSVFEGAYSTGNDTQNIGFMSTRNVNIHNNELKGATEGIMSGGNIPWFAFETNTTNITVTQNYFWKPINAYTGIVPVYLSPTQFQILSRAGGVDCSSVANNPDLGSQCFAYQGEGERCNPSSPPVQRFVWNQSAANSIFTVQPSVAGQEGDIYLLNGALHMDYNFSGAVTCPSGVICSAVASPAFPSGSTRIGIAVIGAAGTFDSGAFYQENRNVWSKNLLESKYGDHWDIEGNVFSGQDNCDGGSTCQAPALQMTVGVTGSGPGDPVNYMASTSYSIIRNNIFEHLSMGISAVGKSFAINIGATGYIHEWAGFGQSTNNLVENNLFIDLGSTEYSPMSGGAMVFTENVQNWTIQHNTAVDVTQGVVITGVNQGLNINSNIVVPYQSACPGIPSGLCLSPSNTTDVGVQNQTNFTGGPPLPSITGTGAGDWAGVVSGGLVDAASSLNNNILMNRSGFVYDTTPGVAYPTSTYMTAASTAGYSPSALFTNWVEGGAALPPDGCLYQQANYRLAPGQAALYPSADGSPIGANIDAIEALTGPDGNSVDQGTSTSTFTSAPSITQQPQSQTISAGQSVTFTITAAGSPNPIYQWQASAPGGAFAPIPGANSNSYTIPQVSVSSNGYQFQCIASNGVAPNAVSQTAILTVSGGAGSPPPPVIPPPIQPPPISTSLSGLKVYPNPWRSDKHAGKSVIFSGLTTGTTIKLFTVSGHEVKELRTDGPSIPWDLTDSTGDKVGSGIYLYVMTDGQGDTVRGKIGAIK